MGLESPKDMTESDPKARSFGYARVSTYGQTLDAQLEQLNKEGCSKNLLRKGERRAARAARAVTALESRCPRRRGDSHAD